MDRDDALCRALREGDPCTVQDLIAAGADIHYRRDSDYDALIDAVYGRDVACDPRLRELLTLLIGHGVDLHGCSSYGETAARRLSMIGRFDAVQLLLEAGADADQLQWSPLMRVIAFGTSADVEQALARGTDLEERDCWGRTPWLLAVRTGDIEKTELLMMAGADTNAGDRSGNSALHLAIESRCHPMTDWLLEHGANANAANPYGETLLSYAADVDDLWAVERLLEAGAKVGAGGYRSALGRAQSRDVILRLLEAGSDPADANQRIVLGLDQTWDEAFAEVSESDFRSHESRRFGSANPERMISPFWEAMIRCGATAARARFRLGKETDSYERPPVWSAERFGQSLTFLPDGRAVQIGGEHEDGSDPEFCIYNDVFVHERDGSITIYGYPEEAFSPTDFHTATLIGDGIYVIGGLGYNDSHQIGVTPVYRLDLQTFRMERLKPTGTNPGWIYKHRAVLDAADEIRVWSGKIDGPDDADEIDDTNVRVFVLNLSRLEWRCVTAED